MHILPQLRRLEQKYPTELAVVGVHTAKFPSERETANIRQAVRRYQVYHPVLNDNEFNVWQQYGIRAWPTLMFIDPQGKVIGKIEGETTFEDLDLMMEEMVRQFDQMGLMDRSPVALLEDVDGDGGGAPLSFPGKVAVDEAAGRLFIADSNHHRIIVASLDGHVTEIIGDGNPGLEDGDFSSARFGHPQGMAMAGDVIYVADTGNHALRRVDLGSKTVETIAGTGQPVHGFAEGGKGRAVALSSPWDVAYSDGVLYIAMAGIHQLWDMDLATREVIPLAGTGQEGLMDGPTNQAWLAQPSGIAMEGGVLYLADSETSSIRMIDLDGDQLVGTLVGKDLFEFGDVDGTGDQVRLQHPLGVAVHDGVLYVADTYNNKIKRLSPHSRETVTLAGTGEAGFRDGANNEALFQEPGGLAVAGGRIYVADTNNHAIRTVDLRSGEVRTLELIGL